MNNFRALNAKTTHAVISLFWSLLSRNGGWFRLFGPLVETWSSAVHPHILQITWKLWLGKPPDTFRYVDTRFDWVKLNKTNKHETERRKRLDLKILGSDLLHNTVHGDITELLWTKYVYCNIQMKLSCIRCKRWQNCKTTWKSSYHAVLHTYIILYVPCYASYSMLSFSIPFYASYTKIYFIIFCFWTVLCSVTTMRYVCL